MKKEIGFFIGIGITLLSIIGWQSTKIELFWIGIIVGILIEYYYFLHN